MDIEICPCCGKPKKSTKTSRWAERYPNGPQGNQFSVGNEPDGTRVGTPIETAPATPLAATWAGHRYGLQALKPCAEFILCAQKPYEGKPVDSIVSTGAGALWIDGARVGTTPRTTHKDGNHNSVLTSKGVKGGAWANPVKSGQWERNGKVEEGPQGRWPPNVALTHLEGCRRVGVKRVRGAGWRQDDKEPPNVNGWGSITNGRGKHYADPDGTEQVDDWQCVEGCPVRALGEQSGKRSSPKPYKYKGTCEPGHHIYGQGLGWEKPNHLEGEYGDTGTAARFYPQSDWRYEIEERLAGVTPFMYQAKAGRTERDAGLEEWQEREYKTQNVAGGRQKCKNCGGWYPKPMRLERRPNSTCQCDNPDFEDLGEKLVRNPHPTVKPIALTRWLATLLLPPPEYAPRRILVPFAGVMSEAIGAILAGWDEVVGVEMEPEYVEIAEARCRFWAGWSERGHDDPKEILKQAAKEKKKEPEPQMELDL